MRTIPEMAFVIVGSLVIGHIYRGYVFPALGRLIRWIFRPLARPFASVIRGYHYVTWKKNRLIDWLIYLFSLGRIRCNTPNGSGLPGQQIDHVEISGAEWLRRVSDQVTESHPRTLVRQPSGEWADDGDLSLPRERQ